MKRNSFDHSLKELAFNASISFFLGIIGFGFGFLFKLLTARYLGAESLGLFEMTRTIFLLIVTIALLGIPNSIPHYIPFYTYTKDWVSRNGYLKFIFLVPLLTSLFLATTLFILAPFITQFLNFPEIFTSYLKCIAFFIPVRALSDTLRPIFIAKKKAYYRNISVEIIEKTTLILGVSLIIIFKLDTIFLIATLASSFVLTFLYEYFIYTKKIKKTLRKKEEKSIFHYKEWFYYSLPLFASGISLSLFQWGDHIVIGKFLTPTLLGIYAVAFTMSDFMNFFMRASSTVFRPLIAQHRALKSSETISKLFRKVSFWSVILGTPFLVFIILFGKELLSLLYGPEFGQGYLSFVILSSSLLIYGAIGPANNILLLHKKTLSSLFVEIFVAIFNIALSIILIPLFGIVGAAIATGIAFLIKSSSLYILARKYEKLPLYKKGISKILLCGIVLGILFFWIKSFFSLTILSLILFLFFFYASYFILIFLSNSLEKEDVTLIKRFIFRIFQLAKSHPKSR
jgi:O-antigen/teichoic acid export membrane protein